MPVLFLTGHTHYRGYKQLDDTTISFEAGHYLDTIGFISYTRENANDDTFRYEYLDTNRRLLFEQTLGFPQYEDGQTENGKELSNFISSTRNKLGLTKEIGCAPRNYYIERHIDEDDSLWGLYRNEVVPKIFVPERESKGEKEDSVPIVMLLSSGTWRYDILNNAPLIVDDIMVVAPFNNSIVEMGTFSSSVILQANRTLNERRGDIVKMSLLPEYILIGHILTTNISKYRLYTQDFDVKSVQNVLEKIAPHQIKVQKTEYTSTMIWISFVQKYWNCAAVSDQLPGWFSSSMNFVTGNDNGVDNLSLGYFSLILFGCVGFLIWFHSFFLRSRFLIKSVGCSDATTTHIKYQVITKYARQDEECAGMMCETK
jgi:hypothetical protein